MRIERYTFDARDGVRGAMLLREASDCYRGARLTEDATRAEVAATRFVVLLESDYAAARVAVQHALSKHRWAEADTQLQRLLALTRHTQPNPYVDWLRTTAALVRSHDERHQ